MFFVIVVAAVVVELELVTAPNRALAWFDHSRGINLFFFSLFAHLDPRSGASSPASVFYTCLTPLPDRLLSSIAHGFPFGSEFLICLICFFFLPTRE
jgi:hypothetical protein